MNVAVTEDQKLERTVEEAVKEIQQDRLVPRQEAPLTRAAPEGMPRRTVVQEITEVMQQLQQIEARVRSIHAEMHRLRSGLA